MLPSVYVSPLKLHSATKINLHGVSDSALFRNHLKVRLSPLKSPVLRNSRSKYRRSVVYPSISKCIAKRYRNILRHELELKWIKLLQTPHPLGFNDNIYHKGNISRLPDFDVFSLLDIRKRNNRSHGKRKNGNLKRKNKHVLTLSELSIILKHSGQHMALSRLVILSISSLRNLDIEANKFYDRAHRLYDAAILTRCYTQHALRPYIDSEINHIRHFIKIQFVNKGIEFINLPSIFKDKSVISSIPTYFENKESPIICYKYNKPIRSTVFNYNKLVTELDIKNSIPDS